MKKSASDLPHKAQGDTDLKQKDIKATCPSGTSELATNCVCDPEDSAVLRLDEGFIGHTSLLGYQCAHQDSETDSVEMWSTRRFQGDYPNHNEDSTAESRPDQGRYCPYPVSATQ
jgi:hypothetical protein